MRDNESLENLNTRTSMPVYFIIEANEPDGGSRLIKIGRTNCIRRRMKELQTGNPHTILLMGWIDHESDIQLEKKLHQKYSSQRQGGEWFAIEVFNVLDELKRFQYESRIATSENAFEIASYDRDGVSEIVEPWSWGSSSRRAEERRQTGLVAC